jgi:hypothetical protein
MNQQIKRIWTWLQGKKTSIGMLSQSIVVYLCATERIGTNEAILITSILSVLGITANVGNAVIKNKAKKGENAIRI